MRVAHGAGGELYGRRESVRVRTARDAARAIECRRIVAHGVPLDVAAEGVLAADQRFARLAVAADAVAARATVARRSVAAGTLRDRQLGTRGVPRGLAAGRHRLADLERTDRRRAARRGMNVAARTERRVRVVGAGLRGVLAAAAKLFGQRVAVRVPLCGAAVPGLPTSPTVNRWSHVSHGQTTRNSVTAGST